MKRFPVIFFLFLYFNSNAQTSFTFPSLVVEYDSAILYRNLKLIPIKRIEAPQDDSGVSSSSFITLKAGIKSGLVTLKERGNYMLDNINVLMIENKSGKDLYLKSGEIVIGGRQDRVFAIDTILPSSSQTHTIPVYCIEENRWSKYEKKFTYGGNTSSGLQKLIDSSGNQTIIWDEIRKWLKASNQTSSSYAALISNKKTADTTHAYIQYFLHQLPKQDSNTVGLIATTGNKILGADIFASTSLFYQTLTNLLEKYCMEAVLHGAPPSNDNRKEAAYANELFTPSKQPQFLRKKGKSIFYKGVLIQISAY